jgi:hypothetical protein
MAIRPIARNVAKNNKARLAGFGSTIREAAGTQDLDNSRRITSTGPSKNAIYGPSGTPARVSTGPSRENIYGTPTQQNNDKLVANSGASKLAAAQNNAGLLKGSNAPVNPINASGSQGGVGTGANGSTLPFSGDPWTGFAGQYAPGKQDDIFANPGIVLQDVLRGLGVSNPTQSGYYYEMEPLADVINEIMLLQNPNAQGSGESAVNYFNTFFKNMATPGGRAPDFDLLRQSLEGADPQNSLGLFLGGANDQRTQMQNFLKLGRAAAEVGLHPYYADAFNQLMAVAANDYMNAGAKGETANFGDYWNQNYGGYMR